METSLSPVDLVPEAAEILAWRERLTEITARVAAVSYDHTATAEQIRGAARTAEALDAAADAIFNAVSTASTYGSSAAAAEAIANRLSSVFGKGV